MSGSPQPSPEWVVTELLSHARRVFAARRFVRVKPLIRFRCLDLGPSVFVELLPSLALAVRDDNTGDLLALTHPLDFEKPDMEGLSNEAALTALVRAKAFAMDIQQSKANETAA